MVESLEQAYRWLLLNESPGLSYAGSIAASVSCIDTVLEAVVGVSEELSIPNQVEDILNLLHRSGERNHYGSFPVRRYGCDADTTSRQNAVSDRIGGIGEGITKRSVSSPFTDLYIQGSEVSVENRQVRSDAVAPVKINNPAAFSV